MQTASNACADCVIDLHTGLAPDLRKSIIAGQVIGPYDMEQDVGSIGGNILHGEPPVEQLFHMRPARG